MKVPSSTYRIQLSPGFSLEQLQENLDYLEDLGISAIYAAPLFQARKGSTHGYDSIDPFTINREIGNLKLFKRIGEQLKERKMGWLQDIVPNHMAFDPKNIWLREIFELGPDSEYYHFFDINWEYKNRKKIMAPFLGSSLEEAIEKGDFKLVFEENGFFFNYFDYYFPVSARSYHKILMLAGAEKWSDKFNYSCINEAQWGDLKISLVRGIINDTSIKEKVLTAITEINKSPQKLQEILDLQYFIPVPWQQTEKEINYRRFFTINDLICLKMEDPKVFETFHYFINELCEAGLITGLRIDHIDGLFDPEGYLKKLREMLGPDFYIIVEKILEREENISKNWPVQGTSGYDFLAQANQLFTHNKNATIFTQAYKKLSPGIPEYKELVYQKKLFIMKERMGGELQNLWLLLQELVPSSQKQDKTVWKQALNTFLAAFPVYRIYPQKFPLDKLEAGVIETSFKTALAHFPDLDEELEKIRSIFLGESERDTNMMLYFLKRCQQFTGPLAAKGVEDTSFYIFNRFVAHNEVGDSPKTFGMYVENFHQKMQYRRDNSPLSLNATATHDTKRGEDSRMRINVLSEIPEEWFSKINEWREITKKIKNNTGFPEVNEEYFIFTTLLAGKYFEEEPGNDFLTRTQAYLQKVAREAKIHSSWSQPNEEYEKAVSDFVDNLFENKDFRKSFDPFQKKIAHFGALKSLGQTLLKCTAPGIPDVYQGCELWDFSYVDPDNRRPVDFNLRKKMLEEITTEQKKKKIQSLTGKYSNGKIKLFCLYKTLNFRKKHPGLFEKGAYSPLSVTSGFSEKIIGFSRKFKDKWVVVILPVLVTELFDSEKLIPKKENFENASLLMPQDAPKEWRHLFTEENLTIEDETALYGLFKEFPVVVLENINS